jgi:hypothetical protein
VDDVLDNVVEDMELEMVELELVDALELVDVLELVVVVREELVDMLDEVVLEDELEVEDAKGPLLQVVCIG